MEGFIISILKNFRFWFNCFFIKFNHILFEKWKWITTGCKGSELIEVTIRQSKSAHRDLNLHRATVNARVLRYFAFNRDACPIANRLKGRSLLELFHSFIFAKKIEGTLCKNRAIQSNWSGSISELLASRTLFCRKSTAKNDIFSYS